eukprot:TRINITY_DN17730_c0_g1_i1.p1 TRINITY_DN17730_c0_g1~~TRINITY_DN17730_c0_g1_i1.p1  ORF type:complete len:819 (+),score=106.30 TRINITY_DN17730_c0_g1_i1:1-2457(+)
MATGIVRLTRSVMTCPAGYVLSYLEKTEDVFNYKCSLVANLGACTPGLTPQVDASSESLEPLTGLVVSCDESHGLQSMVAETSSGGQWIKFRYTCCALGGVPTSIIPTMNTFSATLSAWEGVYKPVERDSSGRLVFQQRSAFRFQAALDGVLSFDRDKGRWCIGRDCVESGTVHPLDETLSGPIWHIVPVTDFDMAATGAGVSKSKKPPKLIKFGASHPEYAEECKDDVTPGTDSFDSEKMFEVSQGLKAENPCAFVGGKIPGEEGGDGQGNWWTTNQLDGDREFGAGDTYANTINCANREIARDLQMAKWARAHDGAAIGIDRGFSAADLLCEFIPEMEAAPMGMGLEFQPGNICKGIAFAAESAAVASNDWKAVHHDMDFGWADNMDCNSHQQGLARIFCDLHCIRDAIKAGDRAILKNLEDAVAVVGQNTQLLLEHYTGMVTDKLDEMSSSSSSASELQLKSMQQHVRGLFAEMKSFLTERPLDGSGSTTVRRALQQFVQQTRSPRTSNTNTDLDTELLSLDRRTKDLHSTVQFVSTHSDVSLAYQTEQNVAEYAAQMTRLLQSQGHMLGVYSQSVETSKKLQTWIRSRYEASAMDVVKEVQDLQINLLLSDLDSSWWSLRSQFDAYLKAAHDQVAAYGEAVTSLTGYTSKCSVKFSDLKMHYTKVMKAEEHAHNVLRHTWASAVPLVGLLAAKVVDTGAFARLARADVSEAAEKHSIVSALCNAENRTEDALVMVRNVTGQGLFGQTLKQMRMVFLEMSMLKDRHAFGGLGNPGDLDTLGSAHARVEAEARAVHYALPELAQEVHKQLQHNQPC